MRPLFLSGTLVLALAIAGCGREEPTAPQDPLDGAPAAAVEPGAAPPPGQQKPLSKTSLTDIVRAALKSESSLDTERIDIENREGTIVLQGEVQSEEQREKAERIVASVGGVSAVENLLAVSPTAATGATGGPSLLEPPNLPPPPLEPPDLGPPK